jgi:5-(carboxyamino)imidazole ribonucleotide synthase
MKTLGILGGGQLGRMLALSAQPLGVRVTVVDPDENAPAHTAADHVPLAYDDLDALDELGLCDVVTFEFENVPETSLQHLARAARPVFPSADALRASQDRVTEKNLFRQLGIPTARYVAISSPEEAERASKDLGPCLFKTRRFGYDGKGQALVRDPGSAAETYLSLEQPHLIAEELVSFRRELSVILCRGQDGEVRTYPVAQNAHSGGILVRSILPAPELGLELEALAKDYATRLAQHLDYVGVLALELFETDTGLLANEFAPRVHNSGHSTIEGAKTSQFENHVRAVLGLPLGSTEALGVSAMFNLLGDIPDVAAILKIEDAHLHDYCKEPRALRKVGHVTLRAQDYAVLERKMKELDAVLARGIGS